MNTPILERYARTPDNKVIIDIDAGSVENLYNDFDKQAPYVKKELDQNLVEYLIDSVREIGSAAFIIQFRLGEDVHPGLTERVTKSVHNYFRYLTELELRELARMVRTSAILLCFGAIILIVSMWGAEKMGGEKTILAHVVSEGLTVAAWVALWNALATFIINWAPHRRQLSLYRRLAGAPIHFLSRE